MLPWLREHALKKMYVCYNLDHLICLIGLTGCNWSTASSSLHCEWFSVTPLSGALKFGNRPSRNTEDSQEPSISMYVLKRQWLSSTGGGGRKEEGSPQPLPSLLHPSSAGQPLVSQSPETPLLSTNFIITSKHRVHTPLPRPLDRSGHFLLHLWTYSRYPAWEEHSRRTEELTKEEDILGKGGEGRRGEEGREGEGRGGRLITSISSVDCCLSHVKSRSTLTL